MVNPARRPNGTKRENAVCANARLSGCGQKSGASAVTNFTRPKRAGTKGRNYNDKKAHYSARECRRDVGKYREPRRSERHLAQAEDRQARAILFVRRAALVFASSTPARSSCAVRKLSAAANMREH